MNCARPATSPLCRADTRCRKQFHAREETGHVPAKNSSVRNRRIDIAAHITYMFVYNSIRGREWLRIVVSFC